MLTGLAAAVAFRAHFYNIGAEGQLYLGALAAVAVGGGAIAAPPVVLFPLMIAAGMAAGAVLLVVPALAKTRLGVDEVVTTLLLNFVALLFVSMMLDGPMKDAMAMGWPQSVAIPPELEFGKLLERSRVHSGLIIAVVLAVVLWVVNARTTFGYEMRAVGANARAARFAGISVDTVMLKTALLSGALAGLAGVGEVAGPRRLPDLGHVAGLRLLRHRDRDAGGLEPAGRGAGGGVRGRRHRRCRFDEPRHRRADLSGRCDRRGVAAVDAGRDHARALQGALVMTEILDLVASSAFWIAVLRIATPLIFGTLGVLLCERAGVLNLGIEGIMVAGAFSGWLAVYLRRGPVDRRAGRGRRPAALIGLLHGLLTVVLALSQHVDRARASRCSPPASPTTPTA